MGPQDCAMLCYALGRLRLRPHPRQLRRLLTCSVPLLCKLTPQGLSNTAWGLAVLDAEPLPPQWSAAFLEASSTNMAAFSNQELALLVWALPRLRIVPSHTWMLALEGQVASRLHSLGPQDVSNLMWGMAQLKHRPDPLLVIEVAQEVAHRITPSWAATATMHCSPTATSSCATTATSSSTPTATTSTTDTSSCAPTATTSTTDTSSSASTATTSNTDTSSCSPPAITSTTDTSSCSPPAITGDTDTTAPSSHAVAAPTPVHGLQASAVQEAGASTSSAPILAHGQQHASFGAEDDGFTAGSNASALAHSLRASASQPEDHGHENLKGISAACAVNKEHGAPGVEHGLFRRDGSQGSPASLEWTEGATTDAATSSSLSSAAASAVREDLAASGVKHKLSRDEGQGAPADTEWTVSAATDAAAGPSSSSAAASTAHEEQIESGEVVGHFRHGGDQQAPAEMEWARVTAPGAAPRSSPGPSTAAAAAAGGAEVAAGTAPSWSVDPFAHGSLHILQPTAKVPPPQQAAPRTLDPSFSSSLSLSPSTNSHYSATTPSLKPPPPRPGIPPSTDPAAWPKRSRAQTISQPRGARIPKAAPAHVPISHPLYSSVSGPQGVATQSIPWPVRSAAQRTTFPHPTPALGTVQSSGRMPSGEQSASLTRPTSSAFRGAFQGPAAPELWEDPSARDLPRPTLSALGGLSHGPVAPQLSWGSSMDLPRPTSSAFQGMLQGPTAPTAWGLPSTPPLTPSSGGLPLKAKQVHSALLQGSPTQRAEPLPGAGLDSLGSDRPALPDSPPSSAGWGPATRPQVLITLLGSCAVFRIMPPSGVLESFARSLGARLHTCNANDLSSAFAALACLRFLPDERWMLRFFAASRMRMPQFSAPQLVALLHGLAGLRVRPDHAWMEWALAEVGQKLSGCQPSHFARLAWALSTLGYRPSAPWLESFCGASQLTLGHSSAHELWMLSCGLAKLGVKARTNSSSGSCSSDISCSQSPARLITSNALFQGLKHPNSSQTPPAETRQGSLFPGPVANTVCASGTDSFPVSDDACDNSPEHQASCSVSVFKGRHHPGRPAAPRSHTRLQQQQQLLQKQQHQQQQEQQQQLQLLQRMHRRRAAHVHTQKQQVNPSAEGSSAGWEDELQVMSDGQLPPSWVLSLQQAVVSHIHDFEPHRLHAVLVALVRLRGAQAPRQHSPPHRRRRRHLQGEQQQQEQQQKHDKLREQGMGALSSAFPSSRPSSGEPRLRQHELHPLFSRASQRPQSAADGLGSVRSPSTVRKEQVAAPSQGVSDGARMGNGSQQQHHEGQQLSKDLCLSEREEQQLSERQQRGERQQLNERLQRNELKERKDAWDAALIDAYSTASLMLLAPPLLVRKRETALKHRGKQTIVARGRC
ncbi:hypothetical protein DUNSADRAFT_14156 [Dunaliella salina]|uniref:Uncharacterized protein n=1 Tax=Dunaliella salina TaxID=3046 RepID=A0ABQ7H2V8_DUNSA|nr:hypothetical protein DUNSADRAFT_14156 [Dunaliella salina]|eukprot:KAF5841153.1 hypothetical protein DUNSADRAFT_14156 [Dunaliella salina]